MISGYSQYKNDFFNKLAAPFRKGKTLLDVGCGDGMDSHILQKEYGLRVTTTDVYKDKGLTKFPELPFKKGSMYRLPFPDNSFDYLFLHDVLHHIDEPAQRMTEHKKGLRELRRVCKKGGMVILVDGNRYNPLFYPHMVKMRGHDHFRQSYFEEIISGVFSNDTVRFHYFEAHLYPQQWIGLFKIYEWIMEHIVPRQFIAYNAAFITKK